VADRVLLLISQPETNNRCLLLSIASFQILVFEAACAAVCQLTAPAQMAMPPAAAHTGHSAAVVCVGSCTAQRMQDRLHVSAVDLPQLHLSLNVC